MTDAGVIAVGFGGTPSGDREDTSPPRNIIIWEGSGFLRKPYMSLVDSVNRKIGIRIKRRFRGRSTGAGSRRGKNGS